MSNPLSTLCRVSASLQDGWVPEDEEAEVNRGTSQAQHLVSMNFQLRVFCRRPARRADSYGFVLPPADDA